MKKWYFLGLIILILSFIFDNKIILLISNINFFDSCNVYFYLIFHWFIVLALMLLLLIKKRKYIVSFIFGYLVTVVLFFILKIVFNRRRPFEVFNFIKVKGIEYSFGFWNSSFPSWHTASAFLIMPYLFKIKSKFRYLWLIVALLIGFNRIYVGIHYLSDIIGGIILGLSVGLLFLYLEDRFRISSIFKK